MPLDDYMGLCNEHYYASQIPFGREGDFITAPEISQMFGEMIAAWLVDIMGQFGSMQRCMILECGPGRGTLMADILRIISKIKPLNDFVDVTLLENSDQLIMHQKEILKDHAVQWVTDIHNPILMNYDAPIFIIGNEFLDALPIKQYIFKGGDWQERGVGCEGDRLVYREESANFSPPLSDAKEGSIYEISPAIESFFKQAHSLIEKNGGAMLWIDYGYTKTGYGDTFQAVKAHDFADPLTRPGEQDLTAHVNFEHLRTLAKTNGLYSFGPVMQKDFLRECGINARANILKSKLDIKGAEAIDIAAKRLLSADEMGALFKVFACFTKHITPAGFATDKI